MQDLYGTLSGIFTAISMVLLLAITVWAWSGRRRAAFDATARLPLEEDRGINDDSRERVP
jgi:cytochrome c oxidase cbb3-type subunit IV